MTPTLPSTSERTVTSDDEQSLHLRDLLHIFLRRRNLFCYVAVPVLLGILVYRFTRPYNPAYMATFDLGVAKEQPVEGYFSQYSETPTTQIGSITQRVISTLLSVNFTSKIVDSLSLFANVKNGNSGIAIKTRLVSEFDRELGPYRLRIEPRGFSLFQNGYLLGSRAYGSEIDIGPVSFTVNASHEIARERVYSLIFYPRERMAMALRNSTSINVLEADRIDKGIGTGDIPGSGEAISKKLVSAKTLFPGMNLIGILRINLYWGNPHDALRIAQVLSGQIIKEDIGEKSLQFIQSRTFIETQLALYKDKLTVLEDNIKAFKETKKISDLQASTQALISQVSALESRKNQIEVEEQIVKSLSTYLAQSPNIDTLPNLAAMLLSSPALQNLYNQLFQFEAELKGKLKEYSTGHPKVLEINAKISGVKGQMKEEINRRMATIKTEVASIDRQIGILHAKLENVPIDEISLARLERDRETAEKLYTFFAEKLEETRVQEAGVTSDLKIVNPAIVSARPVNSRGRLTSLILALVISLLAGGAAIFVAEYFDSSIKDLELVKTRIGLPVFASIPDSQDGAGPARHHAKKDLRRTILDFGRSFLPAPPKKHHHYHLRTVSYDSSAEFEGFRKLSLNIEFAHPDKQYKSIYITSPGPEDGKTYISLNLGLTMGLVGKKALVIDTDFRKKKGHLTDVVKLKKEIGIFDVLQGKAAIGDAIVSYKPDRLSEKDKETAEETGPKDETSRSIFLMPVGSVPPNPFIFLESQKMKAILEDLKKDYDCVLIDGLPLLLFADATYLATAADAVIVAARYGKTSYKEMEDTRDILKNSRANIIGMVVNYVPATRGSYYYHYYYKYYSKYYRKEA